MVIILVRYLYYRITQEEGLYCCISLVVLFMCFLLENIRIKLGFALGLFAIFGLSVTRTRQIPVGR